MKAIQKAHIVPIILLACSFIYNPNRAKWENHSKMSSILFEVKRFRNYLMLSTIIIESHDFIGSRVETTEKREMQPHIRTTHVHAYMRTDLVQLITYINLQP